MGTPTNDDEFAPGRIHILVPLEFFPSIFLPRTPLCPAPGLKPNPPLSSIPPSVSWPLPEVSDPHWKVQVEDCGVLNRGDMGTGEPFVLHRDLQVAEQFPLQVLNSWRRGGGKRGGSIVARRKVTVIEAKGMRSRIVFGTRVSLLEAICKNASNPDEGTASISTGSPLRKCGTVLGRMIAGRPHCARYR